MQSFTHILGRFELPVSQLEPPKETRILQKIDATFVQALKENIKRDPVGTGVPAAVVFTNQVKKTAFQEVLKDAYTYEVTGGLHGYTLLKRNSTRRAQILFLQLLMLLCTVISQMSKHSI